MLWSVGLLLSIPAVTRGVEKPELVFKRHRSEISLGGLSEFEGWLFSGVSKPARKLSENAESLLLEAAKTEADFRLAGRAVKISAGKPPQIGSKLEEECRIRTAYAILGKLRVSGLTTVHEDIAGGTASVVRALPAKAITESSFSWPQCVSLIRGGAKTFQDFALLCEIDALSGSQSSAQAAFDQSVAAGVRLAPSQTPVALPEGWVRLSTPLRKDKIDALGMSDLVELMVRRPFDSVVTQSLAERLQGMGFVNAASSVARWPVLEWRALDKMEDSLKVIGEQFKGPEAPRRLGVLRLLAHTGPGWIPFEGHEVGGAVKQLFNEGKLWEALGAVLDELEQRPSADGANYAAACLLALEHVGVAEIFALLALKWNPMHPFAAANLMLIQKAQKKTDEAIGIARRILKDTAANEWSRAKAEAVLKDIAPR